ncbi:MAG: PQQ-binding-like beta-propeller repeat protein, partial [Paracoccus sp. (in: a-proteobacteria)]|uniref:outer membrane protein assembly factor BamB family protein n=1 Tax=Paracoccus sp. TaxID=267 RepID=UPI0026E0CDAD
ENAGRLTKVWEYYTGDVSDGSGDIPATVWSATPLYVNETLYIGTPFYRIIALDPETGTEKWTFDSGSELKPLTQPDLKNRGVTYWQAEHIIEGQPCQKRVYIGTMDSHLYSVDADTGKLCTDFAKDGVLYVNEWNNLNAEWPLSLLQPPTAYKDMLFVGWAGKDWAYEVESPGTVFAIDARTGEKRWEVEFIPPEIRARTGTSNVWASMSVDEERGILYLPVSSPSPNFWGGNRTDPIPLATSVTAVNADTGEIIWSRQLVHHDLWDFDTNSPPTLVDIVRDGQTIPALVQTGKQGMLYVLNRETGEPIFGIEDRPVAKSTAQGEVSSPTQPFAMIPPPVLDLENWPGVWPLADLISFGECSRMIKGARYDGVFTPPSEEGSILYPGTVGGVEWGGGALDPATNMFYVNVSHVVQIVTLIPREEYTQDIQHMPGRSGFYPMQGAPYGVSIQLFSNSLGIPCWKPPYGTLQAYNLNTGEKLWEHPFGLSQQWGFYGPKSWGSPTIGGPVATAGGVLFIGATMDAMVRAIDMKTGNELWSDIVAAPAVAIPAVYTHKGRQYVAFVAGGNSILKPQVGDQVAVYALPK